MPGRRVYIRAVGIVSPLGTGVEATVRAIRANSRSLAPLRLFATAPNSVWPVGEIGQEVPGPPLPRTHRLARLAAAEAMAGSSSPPDAVILGTTTGGILTTEGLLRDGEHDPARYRHHGLTTVTEEVARLCRCTGPALTLSTACSSSNAALALALAMLRAGRADRVLAGGVDSLCRLTYFGFHSLQLVDPAGARPFDANRKGMSVAEGAAMLLLEADRPDGALAELLGAGLSCDAYHAAAPHPQGQGARRAMEKALADAGLIPAEIDYISLHGTGTPDNDRAEARAVNDLFASCSPLLSSVKGAIGHSLGASGAIEAVLSVLAVSRGLIPANTGCRVPEPELAFSLPATSLTDRPTTAVLSNSFGFGGNNASVVITEAGRFAAAPSLSGGAPLTVLGHACLTGAGTSAASLARLAAAQPVMGLLAAEEIAARLPKRLVRRLKRLPRMALALALEVQGEGEKNAGLEAVFMGTGWGALSETNDFLVRLFETGDQFPSPTDFVGSVHNAPASQIAIHCQATGPNLTTSGGDYSFEQALIAASLAVSDQQGATLVMAADEYHPALSPLFDPSLQQATAPADGGGALLLRRQKSGADPTVSCPFYQSAEGNERVIAVLVEKLGGAAAFRTGYDLILAGLPAGCRPRAEEQLREFLRLSGVVAPVFDYRLFTGEFASASAVAAVMAVDFLRRGSAESPAPGAALVLGFGSCVTAMEVRRA